MLQNGENLNLNRSVFTVINILQTDLVLEVDHENSHIFIVLN